MMYSCALWGDAEGGVNGDLECGPQLGDLEARLVSLSPGTRTLPIAHSCSNIFVYAVSGFGLCWYHGTVYSFAQNDCVGLAGGDGHAISFINEGDAEVDFVYLVFTTNHSKDKVFYPFNPVRHPHQPSHA